MSRFLVNKCICHSRDFAEIKEYAEQQEYESIDQLQADKYCSCSCGLCIPYVEMMFETGQVEFEPGAYYKKTSKTD